MIQPVPRFATLFRAYKNSELVDLNMQFTAPAESPIPLVGDEVLLPEAVAVKAGFQKRIFTVTSRRFLYDGLTNLAGGVVLILSQDDQ